MGEGAGWFPFAEIRYSSRPFPAYRHCPGATPHPIADPRGHSYGGCASGGETDEASELEVLFLFGVDLHNAGYWWEAHEAWETVWLKTTPNTSAHHGLRGLIQVANAHLKLHQGKARAVERLRADFETCFDAALLHEPNFTIYGLALAPWAGEAGEYYARVEETEPGHDPDRFPYLRL